MTLTDTATGEERETWDAYGSVQLNPDQQSFCGCIQLSNNTAELSAVPHVMTDVMNWRSRNMRSRGAKLAVGEPIGVIMLYDSQYTKDQCTMQRPPDAKRQLKNATVVAVCRRLIGEVWRYATQHMLRDATLRAKASGRRQGCMVRQ